MINYKSGNLLDVKQGIIVNGCNTLGVMGAGVALAIKEKYPECFEAYTQFLNEMEEREHALGDVCYFRVDDNLIIANAFTQRSIGMRDGKPPASYDAIGSCFANIRKLAISEKMEIHYPKIGAGLGGLSWNKVARIIEDELFDLNSTCWVL